jgi:hypothetical protein
MLTRPSPALSATAALVREIGIGITTLQETPRTPTSPRAPGTENAERQTPNAFLSPPISGTLFDVLITCHRSQITGSFGASLFPSSWSDIQELLERFPDSVIEFSAFENAVGYLRGRNALFGKSVTTRCFNHEVRRSSLEQLRRSMITITECAESMERIKAAWSNELALGRNSTTPIRGLNGSTTLGRFHADEHRTILQTMNTITTKDGSKTTHEESYEYPELHTCSNSEVCHL